MSTALNVLALAALAAASAAQTIYGVMGANGTVIEMSGPPAGACGYPDGPVASSFNYVQPAVCGANPVPGVFEVGPANVQVGDVAVDREKDIVYVTDGSAIAAYDANSGALIEHFTAVGLGLSVPLTGLGFDAQTGWLWISDLDEVAACEPMGNCAPLPRWLASMPPVGLGNLGDVDMDPQTGELWVCDDMGQVARFALGAAVFTNLINVAGLGGACGGGLGPTLSGLCMDASENATVLAVTDGPRVVRFSVVGLGAFGPAPSSFAFPSSCWPNPAVPPLQGLAYAAHAVTYGPGALQLDVTGQSVLPGAITLVGQGGAAGAAWVLFDLGAACPPINLLGQPLLLPAGPGFGFFGPLPWAGGVAALVLPGALPPAGALPYDLSVFLQVYCLTGGGWVASNGVSFTTARL
jgi:hypothetical protein